MLVLACGRARAGSLPAAVIALLSILCLGAATAPATADAGERAEKGHSSRAKQRAACVKRVTRTRGVSRRAATRICRRRAHRRLGAESPSSGAPNAGSGVSSATTLSAADAAAPAEVRAVPAAAAGCGGSDAAPTAANVATVRAAVLCLVNAQRAAAGLGPLADNAQLTAAAQAHSNDMVARHYFSHTSLEGTGFAARVAAAGWAGAASGENIAWGGGSLGTPAQIVTGWMNSPGHRANILSPGYSSSGVGVAPATPTGGGGGTYTHDFGG